MQNNSNHPGNILHWILGKPDEFDLEHRFFNAACIVGGLSGFLATMINLSLGFHYLLTLTTTLMALLYFFFYYLSRNRKKYKGVVLPYVYISLMTLGYLWFINSGSSGPVFFIIMIALTVYLIITKGISRIISFVSVLVLTTFLYIYEYIHPESIILYSDQEARFYDIYLTALFSLGLISFIVLFILNNYHIEKEVVMSQHNKILNQHREIVAAEKKVRKSKEYVESVISNALDGIIVVDLECKFVSVNDAFVKMIDYNEFELIGRNMTELVVVQKASDQKTKLNMLLDKGISNNIELEFKRKDGAIFPVTISAAYLNNEKSEPEAIVAVVKDITDHKKLVSELTLHKEHFEELVTQRTAELNEANQNLIKAKEKAEESDRLKSSFLSNMSHEIRTPMNVILGFSNLLKDSDTSPQESIKYINIINEKGIQLLNIINDIIDISKVEADEIVIREKPVDVHALLEELFLVYSKISLTKNNIDMAFVLEKNNWKGELIVITDDNRLKQIISNLIDNALKFTKAGSVEFGYDLMNENSDSFIRFYVKDTGRGIPFEKQDIIFNRFRQVDETHTREFGGTGLGLTISKRLVELMGGQIELESEVGVGSTFSFTIPLKKGAIYNASNEPIVKADENYNWDNKTVLIVEDNSSSLLLLKSYLSKTNINVLHAKDGLESVELCKVKPEIDLVLMDIQLPNMNGYEATEKIKKFRPDLKIIAQTAYAMAEDKEKAFEAGCDDYIAKPIDKDDLLFLAGKYLA
jgi:PAS domain S-box-containing protein